MPQALTAFAVFILVAVGVLVFLNRRTREKMREATVGETAPQKPKQLSKRQQRIVSTLEPDKPIPTIEDLVAAEAADTGVNEIPGGADLDVSLKLRVYWRDEVVRRGCSDGRLEFRIDDGIDPATAETEDVRIVCVRGDATPPPAPAPADSATPSQ